MDSRMLIGQ